MSTVKTRTTWDPNDHCLGFFAKFWHEQRVSFPQNAHVLEVGCAEADWLTPMKTLRPDLNLTGVDQRAHEPRPGADTLIQGDVMDPGLFAVGAFDAIVAVSVIEHIGIGCYDDQIDTDGDIKAMANIKQWLKPEGFFYLDVPYRGEGPTTMAAWGRGYSEVGLQARLINGWREVDREVFTVNHEDGPYVALVLQPV